MPVKERENHEREIETLRPDARRQGRRGAKNQFMPQNRWAALAGAFILILAVVGIYFIGRTATRFVTERAQSATQAELDHYAEKIKPLVMFDPPPFESPEKLDNSLKLKASASLALPRLEKPQHDELGAVLLPGSEVRAAAADLFGPNVLPTFTSFELNSVTVEYDAVATAYHIAIYSPRGFYPRVDKAIKKGSTVTLTVSYLVLNGEEAGTVPVKQVTYVLTQSGGNEYISAVR